MQIVGNKLCSNKGGTEGAAIIEGSGVGATRCHPHHDGINHRGVRRRKVARHQGGTLGEQGFCHQWRCRVAPKGNRVSRRPRGILNACVNPIAWKLMQVDNKERGR